MVWPGAQLKHIGDGTFRTEPFHFVQINGIQIFPPYCAQIDRLNCKYLNPLTGMIKLQRIESMHNAGYIHRDIKPNNFVMGFPGSAN